MDNIYSGFDSFYLHDIFILIYYSYVWIFDETCWKLNYTLPLFFWNHVWWVSNLLISSVYYLNTLLHLKKFFLRGIAGALALGNTAVVCYTPLKLKFNIINLKINTLLLKIFNYYHPPLFYVLATLLLWNLLLVIKNNNNLFSFYYKTYLMLIHGFVYLGMIWAFYEETWGGWWNWDASENLSLFFLIIWWWYLHIYQYLTRHCLNVTVVLAYFQYFILYFLILQKTFKLTTHNFNLIDNLPLFYDSFTFFILALLYSIYYFKLIYYENTYFKLGRIPIMKTSLVAAFGFLNLLIIEFFLKINLFLMYVFLIQKFFIIVLSLMLCFYFIYINKLLLLSLVLVSTRDFLPFEVYIIILLSGILKTPISKVVFIHYALAYCLILFVHENSFFIYIMNTCVANLLYVFTVKIRPIQSWLNSPQTASVSSIVNDIYIDEVLLTVWISTILQHTPVLLTALIATTINFC